MISHINTAFPEEKRPMMYKMMKWWGGKPHSIWRTYIENYTKEGDTILDPFCGRGVGVVEAVSSKRKAIGIDLNPIAIFQTKMISKPLDIDKFKLEWNKIKKDLSKIEQKNNFFTTICVACKNHARITTVNRDNDRPYVIFYKCICSKKYLCKKLDKHDEEAIMKSNSHDINLPYPKDIFPDTHAFDMARKNYGDSYDKLFSKRNIYALSVIFDRINKVSDDNLKDFFRFAFISMVHLVSRIPSVRENSNRVGSGSWGRPAYIKLKKRMEINPFVQYERAIESNQGIIKGKINSNRRIGSSIKFAKSLDTFDSMHGNAMLLLQENTLDLTNFLEEESVDYVITDPPYGGLIPYFDLSFMWSSWLELVDDKFKMPFEDEITIDDCRKINFNEYHRRLDIAFDNIFKVLKKGKYMTVTFHNDKPKIFNSILSACQDSGFVLEKILFQMNRRAGETGAATPWGTSVSDFYIRFKKPEKKDGTTKLTDFVEDKFENIVERIAKEVLSNRGEPTEIAAMIPHIYGEMGQSGMKIHFSSDDQISAILSKNDQFVEKEKGLWWLAEDIIKKSKLNIPLSDRVEESVLNKLRQEYKVSYDEILQNIFEQFPNSLTPDTKNVKDILSEYGEKTKDGMWKLKLGMNESEITSKHIQMETILVKIGKKFGYDVWSPDKSKDPYMDKVCIDFNLKILNYDRVKLIDVLWMKDSTIHNAFEVENSTGITSALERGSNIESKITKKFIVLPSDRKIFFTKKMKEPLFRDWFEQDKWQVMLYEDLEDFVKNKGADEIQFLANARKSI